MSSKDEVIKELKEILLLENEDIQMDTPVEIDSMARLLLIAFYDEKFAISIGEKDLKDVKRFGELLDLTKLG